MKTHTVILAATLLFVCTFEVFAANVVLRGSLDNCRTVFETTKSGTVAFIGGSITEMDGYRPMVSKWLQTRFPETEFKFIDAGISSTCSTTGAFRLDRDVLSKGKLDLFFIEFAVNDDQDAAHSEQAAIRGMEGIVRHVRRTNPNCDIVITFFVNENLMEQYRLGKEAVSIAANRKVAAYYGISTIDLAKEITEQIDNQQITWNEFGGVHPAPRGNRICANMIEQVFESAWKNELSKDSVLVPRVLPTPLDRFNYEHGQFLSPETLKNATGWTWAVPDWENISGEFRSTFAGQKLLCAEKPGQKIEFEFDGTAIGAYILAGPDAGILEYQIDDQPPGKAVLYHHFSSGLHYPRSVMFSDELTPGKHRIALTVSEELPEKSRGTAARIMQFEICR